MQYVQAGPPGEAENPIILARLEITNLYYSKKWRFQIHATIFPTENGAHVSENDTRLIVLGQPTWSQSETPLSDLTKFLYSHSNPLKN